MKNVLKSIACICLVLAVAIMPLTGAVTKAEAATPRLSKTTATVYAGKSFTLKVSGTTKKVTWSSSNKAVAKVSTSGKVTGVKKGSATIKAKVGTKTLKCAVTVKPPKATSLTVTTDLPYTEFINGDGVAIKIFEVSVNEFTTSWVKNNFKVDVKPSGAEYVIKYEDAESDKTYSSIPTEPGSYALRFVAKNNSSVRALVIVNVTNDIEEINVATKLKPEYSFVNGDGLTFECYTVPLADFSSTWFKDNFDISTVPANRAVTIEYKDRTDGSSSFSKKAPTKAGSYVVRIGETKGGECKYVWIDLEENTENNIDSIGISTNLKPAYRHDAGNGLIIDCYKVNLSNYSAAWFTDNFRITTVPAGEKATIEYKDRTNSSAVYSDKAPTGPGYYVARIGQTKTGECNFVWIDVVDPITVTTNLSAAKSEPNGDGQVFDIYVVSASSMTSSWIKDNFTIKTVSGVAPEIAVFDKDTGTKAYGSTVPTTTGGYMVKVMNNYDMKIFWVFVE